MVQLQQCSAEPISTEGLDPSTNNGSGGSSMHLESSDEINHNNPNVEPVTAAGLLANRSVVISHLRKVCFALY